MKINFKNIAFIAIIGLLIFFGVKYYITQNKLEKERLEVRKDKIRDDKLVKLSEGEYRKLVADTLTKAELKEKINEFAIKLKNAVIAQEIVYVPKTVEKVVEKVIKTDTTLIAIDYYPKKKGYFAKHTTTFDTRDYSAKGKFEFQPTKIRLAIGQNEDGTYQVITKLPEYFEVTSLDIQSLPMTPEKRDSFGLILGGSVGKEFNTGSSEVGYFQLNGGIRYKKLYIMAGITTSGTAEAGLNIEF